MQTKYVLGFRYVHDKINLSEAWMHMQIDARNWRKPY